MLNAGTPLFFIRTRSCIDRAAVSQNNMVIQAPEHRCHIGALSAAAYPNREPWDGGMGMYATTMQVLQGYADKSPHVNGAQKVLKYLSELHGVSKAKTCFMLIFKKGEVSSLLS